MPRTVMFCSSVVCAVRFIGKGPPRDSPVTYCVEDWVQYMARDVVETYLPLEMSLCVTSRDVIVTYLH